MAIEFKLSPKKLKKLNKDLQYYIDRYNNQYESELEPKYIEARKIYEADPSYYKKMFPYLSEKTDIVSTDVRNTIESIMPNILRIMFQSEEIIAFIGTNEESDKRAKVFEKLIAFQIQRNKNGYMIMHDWFKSGLIDSIGFLKCWWEYEEISEEREAEVSLNNLAKMQEDPKIRILSYEMIEEDKVDEVVVEEQGQPIMGMVDSVPVEQFVKVKYQYIKDIVKNQPEFLLIPPSEIRYDITCKNIDDVDLIIHRTLVTADWLRRRESEGMFEGIENAIKGYKNTEAPYTQLDEYLSGDNVDLRSDKNHEVEEAKRLYLYYECWYETDIDGDGKLEKVVVGKLGDKIIRLESNVYGRHPFFHIIPAKEPYSYYPKNGIPVNIGEIQHAKTAIKKQALINLSNANSPQAFVNVNLFEDVNEFIEGELAVRIDGDPREAVYFPAWKSLDESTMTMLQYLDDEKENITGVTKYNQGMDSSSLNQTATGISRIMDAASQRLEMILNLYIETGIKPLYRYLIKLNQMYIKEPTVIRVCGETFEISPDDLEGKIDIDIKLGLAMGTRSEKLQGLNLIFQSQLQALQIGACGPEHIANTITKAINEIGYKNFSDFVYTPEEVQERMQQQAQQQQEQMQQAIEAEMAKKMQELQTNIQGQLELENLRQQGKLNELMFKEESKYNEKEYDEVNRVSEDKDSRRITATVPIDKVPPAGQVQLASQLGINITEEEIIHEQQADIERREATRKNKQGN